MLAFFVVFIFNLLSLPQNSTFLKFNAFKFNHRFKSLNLKYRVPSKVTSAFELIDIKHLKICYCFLQANK